MDQIKDRLNQAMKENSLTMSDLARATGLNRSTISRYLSGTIEPKRDALGAMAKALHVSPSWLMGDTIPDYIVDLPESSVNFDFDMSDKGKEYMLVIETYKKLSKDQQKDALRYMQYMASLINKEESKDD